MPFSKCESSLTKPSNSSFRILDDGWNLGFNQKHKPASEFIEMTSYDWFHHPRFNPPSKGAPHHTSISSKKCLLTIDECIDDHLLNSPIDPSSFKRSFASIHSERCSSIWMEIRAISGLPLKYWNTIILTCSEGCLITNVRVNYAINRIITTTRF